jgi:[histone H3]-lysine36 N-dimethyltransferase SETMAR
LERLNDEIKKKTSHLKKKKVTMHQDNALGHKSIKTTVKLHELGCELLLHPPYSPDLAPDTFFCLQTSKECLLESNFALMKR